MGCMTKRATKRLYRAPLYLARLAAAMLLSFEGSICLYQAEELGQTETDILWEELTDPPGFAFWPDYKGRDGCRTPMPWQSAAPAAGFSTGKPWLPVPEAHRALAVSEQEDDPDSLLNHYRWSIGLRQKHPALRIGDQTAMKAEGSVLSFRRAAGEDKLQIRANLSNKPAAGLAPWQVEINEG